MKPTLRTIREPKGAYAFISSAARETWILMQEGENDVSAVRRYIAEQRSHAAQIRESADRLEADLNAALEGGDMTDAEFDAMNEED